MTVAHAAEPVAVSTALHRAAPECKLVALLGFVGAVALVGHGEVVPYLVDLLVVLALAAWARAGAGFLARRLLVEVPFVLFVLVLPFTTGGPQVDVLGIGLSEDGLWTAWGIVAKATLTVLACGVLAATTTGPELLAGLERLRVPRTVTVIASFALRYVQVVLDEFGRLQRARVARGDDPRWLWQARTVARTAGVLLARCFARGERVHAAMLARGFDGRLPAVGLAPAATARGWTLAAAAACAATATTVML